MPDTVVIANTSPLLYLHQIGKLDILRQLYKAIIIPDAVQAELLAGKRKNIDVPEINDLVWIEVRPAPSAALLEHHVADLGKGEAEVIALGIQIPSSLIIIDDRLARRIADSFTMQYTGTLGILVKAKQIGHLHSIAEVIPQLRSKGMWLDDNIVKAALQLAGENY
jgi:predicted nucleic acid-binding protein